MSTGYHSVVYGPFKTPRLGASLGVNPIPSLRDGCPKGCLYCNSEGEGNEPVISRAGQAPSAGVVVTASARRIIELSKAGEKVASIVVDGNGEPALHPRFLEITENLRDLRNKWFPKADLCVVCETPPPPTQNLIHALGIYDKPIVRLDWGTAKAYSAATKRTATDFKNLVELSTALDRVVIQSLFVAANATEKEVTSLIRKLEEIKPKEVQVVTLPASSKSPKPLQTARLEKIAATIAEKTGVVATAFSSEKAPA